MLRAVGDKIDIINLMAFEAGKTYDPLEAYRAYRSYYAGGWLCQVTSS